MGEKLSNFINPVNRLKTLEKVKNNSPKYVSLGLPKLTMLQKSNKKTLAKQRAKVEKEQISSTRRSAIDDTSESDQSEVIINLEDDNEEDLPQSYKRC